LAAVAAFNRLRAMGGGGGTRWKALLKSLAVAVVLIGGTDTAFVASYLFLSDGRWYVVPEVDGPRVLNLAGVVVAAIIAVGFAFLLKRAIWPGERAEGAISKGEPRRSLGEDRRATASLFPEFLGVFYSY